MQTFLPYPDSRASARVLDQQRLGKQRVEGMQILSILLSTHKLTDPHPMLVESMVAGSVSTEPYGFLTHSGDAWVWNPNRQLRWRNHPAVLMWKGYENALVDYTLHICAEWIRRGFLDTIAQTVGLMADLGLVLTDRGVSSGMQFTTTQPHWWGDEKLHKSHRSNLHRKDPNHYEAFAGNDLPYYWPPSRPVEQPRKRPRAPRDWSLRD